MSYIDFREAMKLKAYLLAEGLNIDKSIESNTNFNYKKFHLYDHSSETPSIIIPDDIIIFHDKEYSGKDIISRNRFNPNSKWLVKLINGKLVLENPDGKINDISFPPRPLFDNLEVNNQPLEKLVTKLGTDLCGVILSNNCFYFGSKKECKFCEILPTYLDYKSYPTATKKTKHLIDALNKALEADNTFEHIVITTGNVGSYDKTLELFIEVGKGIKETKDTKKIISTATLMPPNDFTYIDKLKEAGFDNVYFDLEILDENLFNIVVPGKADYGYQRLIDALKYATNIFGKGNVFSNLVYGIQTLPESLETLNIDFIKENQKCLEAVDFLLNINVLPVFTVYHSSGRNEIGKIELEGSKLFEFFEEYGRRIYGSNLIPESRKSIIFSLGSTSNTMYNDGFVLAALESQKNKLAVEV
ncbi:radical SAM protein [Sutcliffiella horikoshii]|uniref:radical SAM protein n=1 Tax=Sutcliffiella horikoshii TaxID=79883 RepID=UPI003CF10002